MAFKLRSSALSLGLMSLPCQLVSRCCHSATSTTSARERTAVSGFMGAAALRVLREFHRAQHPIREAPLGAFRCARRLTQTIQTWSLDAHCRKPQNASSFRTELRKAASVRYRAVAFEWVWRALFRSDQESTTYLTTGPGILTYKAMHLSTKSRPAERVEN